MTARPFYKYPPYQEVPDLDYMHREWEKAALVLPRKTLDVTPAQTLQRLIERNGTPKEPPQVFLQDNNNRIIGKINILQIDTIDHGDVADCYLFESLSFQKNSGANIILQCTNIAPCSLMAVMDEMYKINPHFRYELNTLKTEFSNYLSICIELGNGLDSAVHLKPFLEQLEGQLTARGINFCADMGKGATKSVDGSRLGISTNNCDTAGRAWIMAQLECIGTIQPAQIDLKAFDNSALCDQNIDALTSENATYTVSVSKDKIDLLKNNNSQSCNLVPKKIHLSFVNEKTAHQHN